MDIRELLESVSLTDVRLIESWASLKLDPSSGKGLSALGDLHPQGEIEINLNPVSWGRVIETWFRAVVTGEQFTLTAVVAVLYQRREDPPIPDLVRVEFLEKISVMAAFPYLRAQLQSLAADLRVGNLTLDILRQGQFQVAGDGQNGQDLGADPRE